MKDLQTEEGLGVDSPEEYFMDDETFAQMTATESSIGMGSPEPTGEYFMDEDAFESVGGVTTKAHPKQRSPVYEEKDDYFINEDRVPEIITVDFFSTPAAQQSISTFMVDRYGKSGAKGKEESKADYAERYFNKIRWMENNLASTGLGISWLHNADKDQKDNFAVLYTAYTDMPSFYEEGGAGSWNAVTDTIFAAVADPTNVVTLGASMGLKLVGGRMAARTIISTAIRSNAGKIAASVGSEGLIGAMQEGALQSLQQEAGMRTEKDWNTIVGMGLLGGTIGGAINVGALKWGAGDITYADKVKARVEAAGTPKGDSVELNKTIAEQLKGTETIFDEAHARGLMDDHIDPTDMASGKVTTEVLKEAQSVIGQLMDAVPYFQPKKDELLSDAMYRTFDALATGQGSKDVAELVVDSGLDIDVFTNAIDVLATTMERSGIDASEFADMTRLTYKEAGRVLQGLSVIKRAQNSIKKLAPKQLEFLEDAAAEDIMNASYLSRIGSFLGEGTKKMDRIRRAILTSQPVTSARNALSATTYITFDTASELLLNTAEGMGKALRAVHEGNASVAGTVKGTKDIFKDTISLVGRMYETGVTRELADAMLVDHPRLQNILLRTTQEAGTHQLPKPVMMLNALNIAQDQFIRSSVFVNSIERQLKGTDLNMMEILASKKSMPTSVVKRAVDEALKATFADVPKDGLAGAFINVVEKLPFTPIIGTAAFPFARFMASALQFQYKYSPLSAVGGINRFITAKSLKKNGVVGAETLTRKAKKDLANSAVGTAALMAAIKYRADNRDVPVNHVRITEKGTQDISAFFPLPFYLAAAELIYQGYEAAFGEEPDTKSLEWREIIQGVTGSQFKASTVNSYATSIAEAATDAGLGVDGIAGEKAAAATGKFVGELLGHYATPTRLIRDLLGAFDQEHNIVRDANQLQGSGWVERGGEALGNQIIKNVPFAANSLPPMTSATRPGSMYREAPYMTQATGIKPMPEMNDVEKELTDRGYPLYALSPRKGDKEYDAAIRFNMNKYMNDIIGSIIKTDSYKALSPTLKTLRLNNALKEVRQYATEDAEGAMEGVRSKRGYSPADRAKWANSGTVKRRAVNEAFMRANGGRSIDATQSYAQGVDMASELGDF